MKAKRADVEAKLKHTSIGANQKMWREGQVNQKKGEANQKLGREGIAKLKQKSDAQANQKHGSERLSNLKQKIECDSNLKQRNEEVSIQEKGEEASMEESSDAARMMEIKEVASMRETAATDEASEEGGSQIKSATQALSSLALHMKCELSNCEHREGDSMLCPPGGSEEAIEATDQFEGRGLQDSSLEKERIDVETREGATLSEQKSVGAQEGEEEELLSSVLPVGASEDGEGRDEGRRMSGEAEREPTCMEGEASALLESHAAFSPNLTPQLLARCQVATDKCKWPSRMAEERWNLAWWLVMVRLDADVVALTLPCVCKGLAEMARESLTLASILGSLPGAGAPTLPREEVEILSAYPAGRFMAEGGFKRVFKVRNAAERRVEAMGVIDLRSMRKQGLESQLANELWISYLLSQVALRRCCPHFLRLHGCFQSAHPPPSEDWGDMNLREGEDEGGELNYESPESEEESEAEAEPDAKPKRNGRKPAVVSRKLCGTCYQYVLMQLAEYGDMEEACKAEPGKMWAVDRLAPMLFQMLFSLYSAQVPLSKVDPRERHHPPQCILPTSFIRCLISFATLLPPLASDFRPSNLLTHRVILS